MAEIRWTTEEARGTSGACTGCTARWAYADDASFRAWLEREHRCPEPAALPEAGACRITKATADRYTVRAKEGFAWAVITISEDLGLIQIASDYGNWTHYWGASGISGRFKEFLLDVEQDYFVGKLTNGAREYLPDETEREVFREILRARRDDRVTKDEAREAWDAAELARDCDRFSHEHSAYDDLLTNVAFEPIFHGDVHELDGVIRKCLPRSCCRFFDELFRGALVPVLRAELGLDAPAQDVADAA